MVHCTIMVLLGDTTSVSLSQGRVYAPKEAKWPYEGLSSRALLPQGLLHFDQRLEAIRLAKEGLTGTQGEGEHQLEHRVRKRSLLPRVARFTFLFPFATGSHCGLAPEHHSLTQQLRREVVSSFLAASHPTTTVWRCHSPASVSNS